MKAVQTKAAVDGVIGMRCIKKWKTDIWPELF